MDDRAYVYKDDSAYRVRPDPLKALVDGFEVADLTGEPLLVVFQGTLVPVPANGIATVPIPRLARGVYRYQVLVGRHETPAVGHSSPRVIIDP
ncbi:MAG: hypothetical protein KJ066_14965 [Acidobacteria bacterium]|nr:hypothetical protein [Acidobacteriota bacterium]